MTKTHLIKDEALGGVLREYVEVDRKAQVGDKVVVLSDWTGRFSKGQIVEPIKAESTGIYAEHPEGTLDGCARLENCEYKTLEPTDIIHVDGKRYRMVDRKADIGDCVYVTDHPVTEANGLKHVKWVENDGHITYERYGRRRSGYRVLEPVDSQPTDQLDIIARLIEKVAQLEQESTDIKRDLETWAQEVERLKRKLDDARVDIEMVIDDIVTLDERTQPEELAKKLAEAITKGLNAIDPRHFG